MKKLYVVHVQWVIMKAAQGDTLAFRLGELTIQAAGIPVNRIPLVWIWLHRIGRALVYCHHRGVVYLDLRFLVKLKSNLISFQVIIKDLLFYFYEIAHRLFFWFFKFLLAASRILVLLHQVQMQTMLFCLILAEPVSFFIPSPAQTTSVKCTFRRKHHLPQRRTVDRPRSGLDSRVVAHRWTCSHLVTSSTCVCIIASVCWMKSTMPWSQGRR